MAIFQSLAAGAAVGQVPGGLVETGFSKTALCICKPRAP